MLRRECQGALYCPMVVIELADPLPRGIEERARFGCARARAVFTCARANARAFRQFPFRRCTPGKGKFNLVDTQKRQV